jgi:hypothetical protein
MPRIGRIDIAMPPMPPVARRDSAMPPVARRDSVMPPVARRDSVIPPVGTWDRVGPHFVRRIPPLEFLTQTDYLMKN